MRPRDDGERPRSARPIEANDLVQSAIHLYANAATGLLPPGRWPAAARAVARASARLRPARTRTGTRRIERFFPDGPPGGLRAEALLERITAGYVEETMLYARLTRRPDWRPKLTVQGLEPLAAAQRDGRGVVLWSVHQHCTSLLMRAALHDAGHRVHHISHWTHGPSSTRYGRATLGAAHVRVEERLGARVVIPPAGPLVALREIGRIVRGGGIASFRGIATADAPLRLPLLGGGMSLATGAPRTALRSKALLLAVHARREAVDRWTLVLTLLDARGAQRAIDALAGEFARLTARALVESPELWPVYDAQFRGDDPD